MHLGTLSTLNRILFYRAFPSPRILPRRDTQVSRYLPPDTYVAVNHSRRCPTWQNAPAEARGRAGGSGSGWAFF